MENFVFLFCLVLIWLIFASFQDLIKREVADWLNFSLLVFIFGFLFFNSLFNDNWGVFYQGLFGFVIFFVLANIFYYSRFFAGGDTKLMIALGPAITFLNNFGSNLKLAGFFLIFFMIIGSMYGVIWAIYLSFRNFNSFKKDFLKNIKEKNKFILYFFLIGFLFLILSLFDFLFFSFAFIFFITPFVYLYAKSVENTCLIKKIETKKLTEGDWLYRDVIVNKKVIKANWEGLSKNEIFILRKYKRYVIIREGIPFIPVFLFSYIALVLFYYSWNSFW